MDYFISELIPGNNSILNEIAEQEIRFTDWFPYPNSDLTFVERKSNIGFRPIFAL
jgi:hypothetical protein